MKAIDDSLGARQKHFWLPLSRRLCPREPARTTSKKHQCESADTSSLEIEIRSWVTITITTKKARQWLEGGARSPKEAVKKERLRELPSCSAASGQNGSVNAWATAGLAVRTFQVPSDYPPLH